ncbi:hypothetical protein GCM10011506_29210 [Marivirga lumbricoides]|uniref:Right handed beta helix domain-containing protein n=1 Tax=Marivirga lumbricoides TaxID=1046115 RepID=A0ABQ1MK07_9BACT|nr:hypothetical protein GCM10011506_29210 [Marivirga lumbricoides]
MFLGCFKEEEVTNSQQISYESEIYGCTSPLSDNYNSEATVNDGSCAPTDCSKCDFFVSITNKKFGFDGEEFGVKPGDIICLDGSLTYKRPVLFKNIIGTPENPVLITNCNGTAVIDLPNLTYNIGTKNCKYFRISGSGDPTVKYGIKLSGVRSKGLDLNYLSSNFEVDHLEIFDIGFTGIMAKTDPNCDDETIRGNFTMRDVSIHDNYIHDVGGEGLYIGNSFYANGAKKECGQRLPHDIVNIKIYKNDVRNTGWDGIQLGSAVQGAKIYSNTIENFGVENRANQRSGIQIGEGTGGLCFNNIIKNGSGNGMTVLGYGDNIIFNNLIVNPKLIGVFVDERYSPGEGFKLFNNTIVNSGLEGIKVYAWNLKNEVKNNLVINPANIDAEGSNAYIDYGSNTETEANFFAMKIEELNLFNINKDDYSLTRDSPVIDEGVDLSSYGIDMDILGRKRPSGADFDIGAYEFQ